MYQYIEISFQIIITYMKIKYIIKRSRIIRKKKNKYLSIFFKCETFYSIWIKLSVSNERFDRFGSADSFVILFTIFFDSSNTVTIFFLWVESVSRYKIRVMHYGSPKKKTDMYGIRFHGHLIMRANMRKCLIIILFNNLFWNKS